MATTTQFRPREWTDVIGRPARAARRVAARCQLTWLRSRVSGDTWEHEFAHYDPHLRWYLVLRATGDDAAEIRRQLDEQLAAVGRFATAWRAT
jgi:hypothetical protein